MALSYEDIVQGAYSSIGRTGMGNAVGQVDPEGYNFWLNALKSGAVSPDQLYANFNKSVAETVQQQPQVANSQAVASYIAANPLATQIDPKKVVAVGDSTTWGYNAGNQVADNMVTTAQKALGSDYSVSNLGINSTTAGDFLNSSDFDKALSSGAGTVVLNYGMNEAYRNEDPATFANNLLTAVQTLQAVGKKVILQTPNSTSSTDAWAQNVGAYADVVRNVAQQTGTTLDDKYTYTGTLSNATSAADPVHPTAATYGLLGSNLADAIKTTTTGVAPTAISVTPPKAQAAPTAQAAPAPVQGGLLSSPNNVAAATAPNLKDQLLNQWTQLGIKDLPGGISLDQRAADLAETMKQNGINSLADLKLGSKTVSVDEEGGTAPVGFLTNNGQQLGFLGNVNENLKNKAEYLQPNNLVSWTSEGHGNVGYTAVQTADGGVAIVPQWNSSSDMKQVRDAAKMIAAVYGVGTGLEGLGAGASALDAGMGVYDVSNISSAVGGGLSALDAGMGVYPNTGNILPSALDAGMGVYPNTGNILPSALDAGMGVYDVSNISPAVGGGLSALDAGMGVYDTSNLASTVGGLSALDAGMGVYGAGGAGLLNGSLTSGLTAAQIAAAEKVLPATGILDGLTASQIANLVTGGVGLLGGAAAINAVTPQTTPTGVSIPTQGVPLNTADYYKAIQQNYNKILPAMPRDVATPLAQWYNSTYGA